MLGSGLNHGRDLLWTRLVDGVARARELDGLALCARVVPPLDIGIDDPVGTRDNCPTGFRPPCVPPALRGVPRGGCSGLLAWLEAGPAEPTHPRAINNDDVADGGRARRSARREGAGKY